MFTTPKMFWIVDENKRSMEPVVTVMVNPAWNLHTSGKQQLGYLIPPFHIMETSAVLDRAILKFPFVWREFRVEEGETEPTGDEEQPMRFLYLEEP